jgi:YggT family protein
MTALPILVHRIFQLLGLIVLAQVLVSYFLQPFHPVRAFLDQLVEPLLRPIRRLLPQTGMLDFSPLVLLILIQIADALITNLLIMVIF